MRQSDSEGDNGSPDAVGVVQELWRYPVKSLGGERLDVVRCMPQRVEGDRLWAVMGAGGKIGSGKTTRRFRRLPGLLSIAATTARDGAVWITFQDGERLHVKDPAISGAISKIVGEPVYLAEEGAAAHLDDSPVHVVATGEISALGELLPHAQVDARRFRPNIVIDAPSTEGWLGRLLGIGGAVLAVTKPVERCVMVTMNQPGLSFAPGILREIVERHAGEFGIYARVESPGTIKVGDRVHVM